MKTSVNTEKSFGIENISEIYVSASSPNINLIPIDGLEIKAHLHGEVSSNSKECIPELVCSSEKNRIKIEVKRNPSNSINLLGWSGWSGSLVLDVYVPNQYDEKIRTKTSSGDINIENFKIDRLKCSASSGDINISSIAVNSSTVSASSGDINVENFEGELSISTSSGDVGVNVCEGSLDISTSSGKANVKGFSGDLDASTSSGKADIQYNSFDSNKVKIKTSSGKVSLSLPSDSSFNFETITSSGNMNIDFPMNVTGDIGKRHLEGTVGENPDSKIKIKTSSGSININKL